MGTLTSKIRKVSKTLRIFGVWLPSSEQGLSYDLSYQRSIMMGQC